MLHALEVLGLRAYMAILKLVTRVLPIRWPQLFEGAGSSLDLCADLVAAGHKSVLLVTDAGIVRLGLHQPLVEHLQAAGVTVHVYDGVEPDPTVAQIEAGYVALQQAQAEAVLAVGGGSSIDAAKVIAALACNSKSVREMVGLFKVRGGMLPLYVVPTTAGTGSEVTVGAVVSDPQAQRKLPVIDPKLMPTAAALDGALMVGLPPAITAATGMDALTHAVEAYVSRNATAATDACALEAAQLIFANLEAVYADGRDLKARQSMARAAHLAGRAITQAGVGYVHAIAHNFGARYHLPHGLANAIVMPYVLEYSLPKCAGRLAQLARACQICTECDDVVAAQALIRRIRELRNTLGIPQRVEALQEADIPAIATAALAEARFTYAVPRYLDQRGAEVLVRSMRPI